MNHQTPCPSRGGGLAVSGDPCDIGVLQVELTAEPGALKKVGVLTVDTIAVSIGEPGIRSSNRSSSFIKGEGMAWCPASPDPSVGGRSMGRTSTSVSVNCGGVCGPGDPAKGFTTAVAPSSGTESVLFKSRGV